MKTLLDDLKERRKALKLKQHDVAHLCAMTRQQYQQLESKGNPRLQTLDLVAKMLDCRLVLVPVDKLNEVNYLLNQDNPHLTHITQADIQNPWREFLRDDDED